MNLTASTLAELCDHAAAEYPRECCGMIHQSGRVRRCRNIDPRPDRFEFSADDVLVLFESQSTADPITTIYHSHPGAPAIWSLADSAGARAIGEPLLKKLTWLIIECRRGCPVRSASYLCHSRADARIEQAGGAFRLGPPAEGTAEVFHREMWVEIQRDNRFDASQSS